MYKKLFASLVCVFCLLMTLPAYSTTVISGQSNVVIDGQTFSDAVGNCLDITSSTNITIKNSIFINCAGEAIGLGGTSSNITIIGNRFENVRTAFYVNGSTGNGYVFANNHCKNMIGPAARGQCVQFNGVTGTGHRIQNNVSIAYRNSTRRPEDHFNLFNSGGDVGDYLQVTNNYIEGGGPSVSGCGIVAGDFGGSYIRIANNRLINSGNCGIGVAGGSFIVVDNNFAYSRRTDVSNIAITAYASTGPCDNITVTNNRVWWTAKGGTLGNYYLPTSGGLECTNRTYTNNTNVDGYIQKSLMDCD